MSRWFRFYDGALDDPKVQALEPGLFKVWVNLLCVASRNDGRLPVDDLPFLLRLDSVKIAEAFEILKERGLIDVVDEILEPHNWDKRQFKSDVSNERVKRHRQQKSNGDCNGDGNVTKPQHETPPETEQNRDRAEQKAAQPRDDLDKLEAVLRKAAGAQNNPAPMLSDLSPILRLIDSGVSLERTIIPKLRGFAAAGKAYRTWNYPAQAIRDELEKQGKPVRLQPEDDKRWQTRLDLARPRKVWSTSEWGPSPGQPGCRVPAHLLEPGDGIDWQEWKPEAAA